MRPEHMEEAAASLVEARLNGTPVRLPRHCRPVTLDDAYGIQDRVTARLGWPLAGWKIGATSARVAAAEGAIEPVSGRLFARNVHQAPAELAANLFTSFRNCEVEFVVELATEIAPRPGGWSREDLLDALGPVRPAIEIGDSRLVDRASAGILAVCADNSGGTHLVLGEPVPGASPESLPDRSVRLDFDGAEVARGTGAEVMGDPIEALAWLTRQRHGRGETLPAGALIATGSCTGINIAPPGTHVVADFGDWGVVEIRFERVASAAGISGPRPAGGPPGT